jgi:hypothetical protein
VYGLGKRLEGNYGVFKVNHTIGDGYLTRLELVSNTSEMSRVLYTPPKGQINTQQIESNPSKPANLLTVPVSAAKGD